MEENPPDYLSIIGQLAREYEEKSKQIQTAFLETGSEEKVRNLMQLSEQTTARFRAGQMALFTMLDRIGGEERQQVAGALTALSRCFDEMRILFSF